MTQPEETLSPCIGVCVMNSDTNLCEGCFRTLDEIAGWWDYSVQEKKKIMTRTQERCQRIVDGTFFD